MPDFQPISVARLYRLIANQIKEKIRDGKFRTGDRLPSERELAGMLAVSRPSVREALIALEIEGWVEVRVGAGVFVTSPESHLAFGESPTAHHVLSLPMDVGAADLLETRLLVEPHCAELAARVMTETQMQALTQAAMALPGSEDPARENDRFHLLIAQASGNWAQAAVVQLLSTLSANSAIFNKLNQHFVYGEVWELAHKEHLTLLEAIQKGDPAAAHKAMREHLLGISSRLGLDASEDQDM